MAEAIYSMLSALVKVKARLSLAKAGLFYVSEKRYLTTDWKSGEVRRLANWLSEEE